MGDRSTYVSLLGLGVAYRMGVVSFRHLKAGDKVTRMLAGTVPMTMIVKEVLPERLVCDVDEDPSPIIDGGYWEFCRNNLVEIDEEWCWGPACGVTGSFLKEEVA